MREAGTVQKDFCVCPIGAERDCKTGMHEKESCAETTF